MNLAECRRVVLRVIAAEQGVFHHRLAQARFGVGLRHRIVHTGKHVAGNQHIGASLQAYPYRARVLADGHAVVSGNAGVLDQLVQNNARAAARFGFARCHQARQDIVGNAGGKLGDKRLKCRFDVARGYR